MEVSISVIRLYLCLLLLSFFPTILLGFKDKLCIQGVYGRNANRIITLANGIEQSRKRNLTLALGKEWSSWYLNWFDKRHNIELNYVGKCAVHLKASFLYFDLPLKTYNSELFTIRPKKRYWMQALNVLDSRSIVTVHRRWFEGECKRRANLKQYFCMSAEDYSKVCFWTQQNINKEVDKLIISKMLPPQQKIFLFTDQQNSKYDRTFEFKIKRKFQVEMCMMALSSAHFGSPMSSIDYIVAHWRTGLQFPIECFGQIHPNETKNSRK